MVHRHVMHMQVRLMHERGYHLGNVDITIIAQQPKLSPHKENMREQLCQLLGSHPSTVNIKVSFEEFRKPHVLAIVCCMLLARDLTVRMKDEIAAAVHPVCRHMCSAPSRVLC